jgi:hypothetical protein
LELSLTLSELPTVLAALRLGAMRRHHPGFEEASEARRAYI